MIVDISHVSDKTFWDVLEVSAAPPFASHSSCRAFCNAPRDMTDEMIVALAKKPQPRATLADVVKHIDHVVKIAGIGAVGIGSDFDGVDCVPTALLEKGYSAEDIRKIYGGNTLRLMRAVEAARGAAGQARLPAAPRFYFFTSASIASSSLPASAHFPCAASSR